MKNKLTFILIMNLFGFICLNAQFDYNDILINEIVASNDSSTGISDNDVEYDDYIELYNTTNVALLLDNFFLSDSSEFPTKWKFPNGIILNANEYLIVWCDNDSSNFKGIHTNFRISKSGDDITLSAPNGAIVDQVIFGQQQTGLSYSRTPNLSASFSIKKCSPKADNDTERGTLNSQLVINEFVADSDSLSNIEEIDGGFPDWLELYNNSNESINLFGYYLSDNGGVLTKWAFPPNSFIDANGYIVLFADKDVHQSIANELHTNFRLSKNGESIFLYYQDGTLIDNVSYSIQNTNVSFARVPNGTGNFQFSEPTYNANNNTVSTIEYQQNVKFSIRNTLVKNYLIIESNLMGEKYAVFLSNGTLVKTGEILNPSMEINTSQLESGNYILKIKTAAVKFQKL